jgi:hypothetical protein
MILDPWFVLERERWSIVRRQIQILRIQRQRAPDFTPGPNRVIRTVSATEVKNVLMFILCSSCDYFF